MTQRRRLVLNNGMALSDVIRFVPETEGAASTLNVALTHLRDLSGISGVSAGAPLREFWLNAPALTGCTTVYLEGCGLTECPPLPPNLTTLVLDGNLFTWMPSLPTGLVDLAVASVPLTELPVLPVAIYSLMASGCAFTGAAVNSILAQLVANGVENGGVDLSGGTSAAPSGQGVTDAATLVSRGWTVTHN